MNPIQIPLKMRVWAAVRNRPGSTVQDILNYLKSDKRTSVAPILTLLEHADLVYSTGNGGFKDPKKYFTEDETFDAQKAKYHHYRKYIVNPLLNIPKLPKKPSTKPEVISETPKTNSDRLEALFDTLTMNECRALYQRLHTFFG